MDASADGHGDSDADGDADHEEDGGTQPLATSAPSMATIVRPGPLRPENLL